MKPERDAPMIVAAIALIVFILFMVSLFGCATANPPPPKLVAGTVTVEPQRIPVLMPCLTEAQIPKPPSSWMNPKRSGWHNEVAAAIDLKELDEYIVRSQSRMWACVASFEEPKK